MPYHFPIKAGDRVALAPHTDLWMGGVRFGTCAETAPNPQGGFAYRIVLDKVGGHGIWMSGDDLLGAVRHPSGQAPLKIADPYALPLTLESGAVLTSIEDSAD